MIEKATSRRAESGVRERSGLAAAFVVVVAVCLATNVVAVLLPARRFSESPDVVGWLVGVVVLASGAFLVGRGRYAVGALTMGAAVLWHLPDVARLLPGMVGSIAARSALIHVSLLGLAVSMAAPAWVGRLNRRLVAASLVLVACSAWIGAWKVIVPSAGGALLVFVAVAWLAEGRSASHSSSAWVASGVSLGAALLGSGIARALTSDLAVESWLTGIHQLAVASTAALLGLAEARSVAVDAIDLQFDSLDELESVIAGAMGLPTVSVSLAAADGGWLDVHGAVIEPADQSGLLVDDGAGGAVALVGVGQSEPNGVPASVRRLLRLARDHARLRATITGQVDELERSRRRILAAQDQARAKIDEAMRTGPLAVLAEIERNVAESDGPDAVRRAAHGARTNIERLTHDLDPVGYRPLATALHELVQNCPANVRSQIDASFNVSDAVARTVWFTVSEGLSNAVKHAPGATVWVTASQRRVGVLSALVTVVDDGPGGVDPVGFGLRGLADRAEAMGGSLVISREPGGGTRLELRV